jgi:hypothetical protein
MNDMVATEARDTPFHRTSAKLAAVIRNQGSRISSGPADFKALPQKAGHMSAASQKPYETSKTACQAGPFSIASPLSIAFCRRPRLTVLSAVGIIRRNIWSEAQVLQCPQRAGMQ